MGYKLVFTTKSQRDLKRIFKADKRLIERVEKTFTQLIQNPFNLNLKTHKVYNPLIGECFSSKLTGDLRVIWRLEADKLILIILAVGGHSGKHKVY